MYSISQVIFIPSSIVHQIEEPIEEFIPEDTPNDQSIVLNSIAATDEPPAYLGTAFV